MNQGDLTDRSDPTDPTDPKPYACWVEHDDPSTVANAVICLIHQANYLLDRQIAGLERQFVREGGYSEKLAAARIQERRRQGPASDHSEAAAPNCPDCGEPMVLRTARQGKNAGAQFWGCAAYPQCRGTRAV